MRPVSEELPVEAYERRLDEQRGRAQRLVYACYGVTLVPYVASWIVALWPSAEWWMFSVAFWTAFAFGVGTGVVTLWKWPLLSWGNRLFGLAPWFYFSLMALPMLIGFLS
ncbi:MAG: hypothetical protein M3552_22240 [Planctomycetota bacterium]|nr:hypothetical protein [Planctomycetaceae bacterium]MDQ3333330.1 hypothetical protein [Planctomycetota bacterium]